MTLDINQEIFEDTQSEINQELFQEIHDLILTDPQSHRQFTWESEYRCGTTRCIAGWAHHLTTGETWFKAQDQATYPYEHPEVIAERALGLSHAEAIDLFYDMHDDHARQKVEHYALKGREGLTYRPSGRPVFPWERDD